MQKLHFKFSVILICITFWFCSCFISGFPDPDSVKYDSASFNPLAKKIIAQNKIWEMDDFKRHYKKVNGIFIRLEVEIKERDDSTNTFITKIIDSLNISKADLEELRKGLEQTQLREFYKSNDSILFVTDGILNHSWGYFYTDKPSKIDTFPFRLLNKYIRYDSYVNENWRKVNIGL